MKEKSHKKIFRCLGASNHVEEERQHLDFYATHPCAAIALMMVEKFDGLIWEPAAGNGHLAKELRKKYTVFCSYIVKRDFPCLEFDFLNLNYLSTKNISVNIVTNPPYSLAQEFIETSLRMIADGYKVCMFLKLTFCEGKKRGLFFKKYPPKRIYVFSSRVAVAKNGDFDLYAKSGGSAICYAWFVWEKGYTGETTLVWIPWFNKKGEK